MLVFAPCSIYCACAWLMGGALYTRARKRAPPSFSAARVSLALGMGTNAGWPEAFGFSVGGGAPVVIRVVEDGGSAQAAGLQPGDVIAELDGEDVQQWSLEQVIYLSLFSFHVIVLCYRL